MLRVTKFCDDFRAATFGESRKTLAQENQRRYKQFKHAIHETRPDFRPFIGYEEYRNPALDGPGGYTSPPVDLTAVQKVIAELVTSI
jgi:vacuolar protein sorting-associated protein 1